MRYLAAVFALALAGCGAGSALSVPPPPGADSAGRSAAATSGTVPTLYVAGPDRIVAFAPTASGYAAPQRSITGSALYAAPTAPGADPYIRHAVAGIGTGLGGMLDAIVNEQDGTNAFSCTILVYGPAASGDASPQQTPACSGSRPHAVVGRPSGAIDYLDTTSTGYPSGGDQVARVQANGNALVRGTLTGSALTHFGLAEDAAANAYVSGSNPNRVDEYATSGAGLTSAPVQSFALRANPGAVAVAPDGTVYVAIAVPNSDNPNVFTGFVEAFVPGGTSAAREIGPFPNQVAALAVDSAGELFVGINAPDNVTKVKVYAANANGSATPLRVLQNPLPANAAAGATIVGLALAG